MIDYSTDTRRRCSPLAAYSNTEKSFGTCVQPSLASCYVSASATIYHGLIAPYDFDLARMWISHPLSLNFRRHHEQTLLALLGKPSHGMTPALFLIVSGSSSHVVVLLCCASRKQSARLPHINTPRRHHHVATSFLGRFALLTLIPSLGGVHCAMNFGIIYLSYIFMRQALVGLPNVRPSLKLLNIHLSRLPSLAW